MLILGRRCEFPQEARHAAARLQSCCHLHQHSSEGLAIGLLIVQPIGDATHFSSELVLGLANLPLDPVQATLMLVAILIHGGSERPYVLLLLSNRLSQLVGLVRETLGQHTCSAVSVSGAVYSG